MYYSRYEVRQIVNEELVLAPLESSVKFAAKPCLIRRKRCYRQIVSHPSDYLARNEGEIQ